MSPVDPQIKAALREIVREELDPVKQTLRGDPSDREDGGLVGDMRDVKRFMRGALWVARLGGAVLLTSGGAALIARLVG